MPLYGAIVVLGCVMDALVAFRVLLGCAVPAPALDAVPD
jgi:hypothetical protein